MKTKDLLKRFFSHGAILYTAGSVALMLFSFMLTDSSAAKILSPERFLYFALFAYIVSLGSTLYISGILSPVIGRTIHALCYNIGFFVFLLLCNTQFHIAAIFTLVFAIIYAIAVSLSSIFKKRISRRSSDSTHTDKKPLQSKKAQDHSQKPYQNRFS